ncbi:hypothetical protein BLA29_005358 [Euroglyphus maynei]|uniref:Uncharacterized protein n=1 Tax=Euroglyphus maynei TaxID=6958 RepID=A0A1Y3BKF8_EURMA|nr:hypothetical protein BLA29_005358 [Euroglyphus maynei]
MKNNRINTTSLQPDQHQQQQQQQKPMKSNIELTSLIDVDGDGDRQYQQTLNQKPIRSSRINSADLVGEYSHGKNNFLQKNN